MRSRSTPLGQIPHTTKAAGGGDGDEDTAGDPGTSATETAPDELGARGSLGVRLVTAASDATRKRSRSREHHDHGDPAPRPRHQADQSGVLVSPRYIPGEERRSVGGAGMRSRCDRRRRGPARAEPNPRVAEQGATAMRAARSGSRPAMAGSRAHFLDRRTRPIGGIGGGRVGTSAVRPAGRSRGGRRKGIPPDKPHAPLRLVARNNTTTTRWCGRTAPQQAPRDRSATGMDGGRLGRSGTGSDRREDGRAQKANTPGGDHGHTTDIERRQIDGPGPGGGALRPAAARTGVAAVTRRFHRGATGREEGFLAFSTMVAHVTT